MSLGAASMVRMPRWRGEASVLARHTDSGRAMTRIPWKIALLALAAAPALATPFIGAPAPPAQREASLQGALERVVAAGVPGAVLLVREPHRTIRLRSGHGSLNPKTPMRGDDRFRVGSITKPFVATIVLELVGEGKLGLDDTVERWL